MGQAIIKVRYADGRVEQRRLELGKYKIGRERGDLVLGDDAKMSSLHAELEVDRGAVSITDLGSRNGTRVSGTRLTGRHCLQPGQPVQLGESWITLLSSAPARAVTVVQEEDAVDWRRRPEVEDAHRRALDRYEQAKKRRCFWEKPLQVIAVLLTGTVVAFLVLLPMSALGAVAYPAAMATGLASLLETGIWKALRDQHHAAKLEEDEAVGTLDGSRTPTAERAPGPSTSLWRVFRGLPALVQLLLWCYAWFLLIPLWLIEQQRG
jgi:Inner membrane component of T3SS, cytoplasmic domain